jgi:SAM-dependent methyltransferase
MAFDDRLRDTVSFDLPYEGWVADAYECFMPHDAPYADDRLWRRRVEASGGRALELGCGTGRLLLRYVAAGLDVEGVDSSADMLAICRRNARARGVEPVLHHGSMAPLALDRRYRLLYCPTSSFTLLYRVDDALVALRSFLPHLEPGGSLQLSLHVPWSDMNSNFEWRVRRSATRESDGVTIMVHEAVGCDRQLQLIDTYLRYEWYGDDGVLLDTRLRKHRLRWWYQGEITRALEDAGYVDVSIAGTDDVYIVTAHAPT